MTAHYAGSDEHVAVLAKLCPFFLLVDEQATVAQVGPSLLKLCPELVPGAAVEESLTVSSPRTVTWRGEPPAGLVLLLAPKIDLTLRGQLLPLGNGLLFFGSPWMTDLRQLDQLGLSLADFAPHDPVTDFLMLLQAQTAALADAQRLAAALQAAAAEQSRLMAAERALAAELDALPDLLLRTDLAGRLVEVRPSSDSELPAPVSELLSTSVYVAFPALTDQLRPAIDRAAAGGGVCSLTCADRRPDRTRFYEARVTRTSEDEILIVIRDVTERRELEEQLTHQALHDPLTGLANRTLFADRISHALATSRRHGTSCAVLLIDLDDFKPVNDTLGHQAGDHVLQTVAARISAATRAADTVARLGGDEFAVLIEDVADDVDRAEEGGLVGAAAPLVPPQPGRRPATATDVATRILESLAEPVRVGATEITVGASLGLALCPAGAGTEDEDDLLRRADRAMYDAKRTGKGALSIRKH